jgi:DNA-directed RNA polymerase subunit K/omega
MPPKQIKIQSQIKTEIPKKTIIIKKIESKPESKSESKPESKKNITPQLNLITSQTKIVEPVVQDSINNKEIENIDDNIEEIDEEDKVEEEDEEDEKDDKVVVEEEDEEDEKDDKVVVEEEDEADNKVVIKINKPINIVKNIEPIKNKPIQNIKDNIKDKVKNKEKDNKVHNHSKPKTIIASTTDINTVDMFGEDDLDFRYVMMNYDYTKNITIPKITKYERALLIGKRAKQIEEGANPNVKYISGQSVISIAEEELRQRKIPLIIKRPIGNKFEYWKPADMEVNMD